ncbi:glycosyltransferase [candidate division TA06 bacterium]|uniref:Glycosyltransferase n=1 Tax=candidate division TA06 bacterium TaxID=2250710 RepID=A0A933MKC7_UNCT6|nr:glycosyltransferase [candidate division TA06 bacterium]
MKIFFASYLGANWMSGWQRACALENLGHQVTRFCYDRYDRKTGWGGKIIAKLLPRPFDSQILSLFNKEFYQSLSQYKPDVAWIEKPLLLLPDTLSSCRALLPNCVFVCFQDDDPFGFRNKEEHQWRYFKQILPLFDFHLLKKNVDLEEFPRHGAKRVIKFRGGYFGQIFRPYDLNSLDAQYKWPVSFVGTALDKRIDTVKEIVERYNIDLHVCGNSWNRHLVYYLHRERFHPAVHGEGYAKTIAGSKISLGFVSFSNRDEFSMRSFEIPACRGFFLGQRTGVHRELYREGVEAEFFDGAEECADKIRFYLSHDSAREKVASAGYKRCIESDYSLEGSLRQALKQIIGSSR